MNLEKKKKNQPWSSTPQHFLVLVKFRQEDNFQIKNLKNKWILRVYD
jgi:hypothetical protein